MKGNTFSHEICRECIYRNHVHSAHPCRDCGKDNDYKYRKLFNSENNNNKD